MSFPISESEHTLLCAIRSPDFKQTTIYHERGSIYRIESAQDINMKHYVDINEMVDAYAFQDIFIRVHKGLPHITQTIKQKI
jgi:hypothetical protein